MEEKRRIRKIIERTNCTYDQALMADKACGGNIEEAVEMISKNGNEMISRKGNEMSSKKGNELYVGGGSSGLAVDSGPRQNTIVGYRNGLLVNEKFYDYSDPNNLRLKEMLKNNEFDRELLETSSTKEEAEVIYKDCTSEDYNKKENTPKKKSYDENKKHVLNFENDFEINCPDEIQLGDGEIIFKVMIGNKRVTVKMSKNMSVEDFYSELKKYTPRNVILVKRGNPVDDKSSADNLKNSMFVLQERK